MKIGSKTFRTFMSLVVMTGLVFTLASPTSGMGIIRRIHEPGIFVLSIGIDKYDSDRFADQRFSVSDAVAISERFGRPLTLQPVDRARFVSDPSVRVTGSNRVVKRVLKDSEVTRERIAAEFDAIAREIDAEDVFVFNFAGLGQKIGSEFVLFMPDAANEDDAARGIKTSELQAWFRKIRSKNKLIILDSCDSTAGYDAAASAFIEPDPEVRRSLGSNVLFIGTDGLTFEDTRLGHGVLSKAVLDGVSGEADIDQDGTVRARELEAYIYLGVLRYKTVEVRPRTVRSGTDFPLAVTDKKRQEVAVGTRPGSTGNSGSTTTPDRSQATRAKVFGQPAIKDAVRPRDGDDYALLFANDKYDNPTWETLKNPINDVNDIATELRERYGFKEVVIKHNMTTREIRETLAAYQSRNFERPDDQLFVYFAGHGVTNRVSDLASDSYYVGRSSPSFSVEDSGHFLSLDSILGMIAGIKISHAMAVFDACYAGQVWKPAAATYARRASLPQRSVDQRLAGISEDFGRGIGKLDQLVGRSEIAFDDRLIFAKRTMNNQSKIVLTSGNRPVLDAFQKADGTLSRNSPFADRVLESLRIGGRNFGVLTANEIYSAVLGLPVKPEIGQLGGTDGDFVFVSKARLQ